MPSPGELESARGKLKKTDKSAGALSKAFLEIEEAGHLDCMFNPESFSLSAATSWESKSTSGGTFGINYYKGHTPASFSLELLFDTTSTGKSVTSYTDKCMALLKVNKNIAGTSDKKNNGRPSTVVFHWADFHSPRSVVESVSVNYTYWSHKGIPLRATVSMSLKQWKWNNFDEDKKTNPTSGTPQPHRVHRVQPGETLDRISARYYGTSNKWRALAAANAVEDPLAIRPGSLLNIPQVDEV